ncbi:MAG TPA: HlyD family efflux transporter periplasmic adaptor subunit [Bryobacteraceae bacterium]|nr:HlyD family efflux transporter periplasmic adaptor subunit [Bryobacteraceae bacterium]
MTDQKPAAPAAPPARPRGRIFPLIIVVLGVAAFFIWRGFFASPKIPDNLVVLSGRMEGDDSAVAPKVTGRLLEIRVREGDSVKSGDTIAVIDDEQVKARQEQAKAALAGAEARRTTARDQIAVLEQELQQNNLTEEQAKTDAAGKVRNAEASVAAAESDLAQLEAQLRLAQWDNEAYQKLVKTGAVSERQGKQAAATADQQEAAVLAARRRLEAARGSLTIAEANLANPGIRAFATETIRKQIAQQQGEIANANAAAQQAQYQLQEANENSEDLIVRAPFDGTVMTRAAEPGEVVSAGTAIVTLLDLSKVYLRGFIPEGEIGKVKIGQAARVYLDSAPDKAISASVLRIDPQATFTPENTYFRDDRVKQVVGVKLQIGEAVGFAKPGMPADGEILVSGRAWPAAKFVGK